MDYKQTAENILSAIGGKENVAQVVHCATRLRFNLSDSENADAKAVEGIEGVKGTLFQGGQFQVIIGNEVTAVYDEVIRLIGEGNVTEMKKAGEKKGSAGARLISTLTEIFAPALPAITGAGMFKALLAAVLAFQLMDTEGSTYRILAAMSDAAFYFLPMLIGYTSAKKFGGNPTLVLALAGLLLYPDFAALLGEEGQALFFGIPVTSFTYSASVIPIILIAFLEARVEKLAYKYVPGAVRYFIAPLLVLIVCGTAGILLLGPVGGWVGDIIAVALQWFVNHALIGGCLLIGVMGPIIGMTGIHQSFTPITISMFMQFGFDPLMFPATLACNMSQCGIALAAGLRAKDKSKRSMLLSSSFTALMGITEPALFGCTIKSRKNMMASMIGGGVGATLAGILSLKAYAISGPGLASITMFLGGDAPVRNIISAFLVMALTIVVTFLIGWFVTEKDDTKEQKEV